MMQVPPLFAASMLTGAVSAVGTVASGAARQFGELLSPRAEANSPEGQEASPDEQASMLREQIDRRMSEILQWLGIGSGRPPAVEVLPEGEVRVAEGTPQRGMVEAMITADSGLVDSLRRWSALTGQSRYPADGGRSPSAPA
jgi:hypothetical protein